VRTASEEYRQVICHLGSYIGAKEQSPASAGTTVSMPNIRYRERKVAGTSDDPTQEDARSNGEGKTATHDSLEEG